MKHFWGILIIAVLVACSPSSVVNSPTLVNVPTNTPNTFPNPTAEVIPSEVALHPENISTSTPLVPKIESIVPETREVKLSELGLTNTTRLILYYQPSDSLRIMSGQDIQPQRIPNIKPQAWIWSGVEVSPNQKWFIYSVFTKKRDNTAYYDYWISSIDGKEQKIAVSDVMGGIEARWASNEQLELWDFYTTKPDCPKRILLVNPFTQETSIPPDLPPSTIPQCFYGLSTNSNRSKIIYRNQDDGLWNIYDVNTRQNQIVFPWLSESERFDLVPPSIQWLESGITLVIPQHDSIVFNTDLPASDISKNYVDMNKILLPDGKKMFNETFSWRALDKGLIGFDLIQSDYNYVEGGDETPSSDFMVFDLKNSILYDYNLDRARTANTQNVSDYFVRGSADNRFLAWTIFRPPGMGVPIETVVLNRETGQIARIKGFEFFGWGEINQP